MQDDPATPDGRPCETKRSEQLQTFYVLRVTFQVSLKPLWVNESRNLLQCLREAGWGECIKFADLVNVTANLP